jgi:hypothetical protein
LRGLPSTFLLPMRAQPFRGLVKPVTICRELNDVNGAKPLGTVLNGVSKMLKQAGCNENGVRSHTQKLRGLFGADSRAKRSDAQH